MRFSCPCKRGVTLGPVLRTTPLRVVIEAPQHIVVLTSPGTLYPIVSNLILDAVQHAYPAGQAGTLTIRLSQEGGETGIDVGDDGRGMDEQERARGFEPFFTTRRGRGGSGLGHIVYNLVTQVLGGRITCDSRSGAGTRFTLRRTAPQPAGDAGRSRASAVSRAARVAMRRHCSSARTAGR